MLVIEYSGFKKYERKNIAVHPADQLQLADLKLEIGSITETMVVEGSAITLKTETVQLDTVITGDQATNLPIVDRGFLGLLQVIPGYASGDQYGANISGNRSCNMSFPDRDQLEPGEYPGHSAHYAQCPRGGNRYCRRPVRRYQSGGPPGADVAEVAGPGSAHSRRKISRIGMRSRISGWSRKTR